MKKIKIKIKTFSDLPDWENSHELVKKIYRQTKIAEPAKAFGFKDQLQKASISIVSNIARGFERNNNIKNPNLGNPASLVIL